MPQDGAADPLSDAQFERASLVRAMLDAFPGGLVQIALDGAIVDANSEAVRLLGLRLDAEQTRFVVEQRRDTLRSDGTPLEVTEHPAERVLVTGEPQGPSTIGFRNGEDAIAWLAVRATPLRDGSGALVGALVAYVDTTEFKHVVEEGRDKCEAKWRSLAESLTDVVVVTDLDERILSIHGMLPECEETNIVGSYAYSYIQKDYVDEWRRYFATAVETARAVRFETRGADEHRRAVWYEQLFLPIGDVGNVERMILVARNITERRTMIARLAEKERLASVGMVAASVAHEIMNPLTYVLANLDFALSERCPPGARKTKAILDAREGAARMQQIVWDLRSLGRTGAEELFYVDVRSVIETALRLAGPEISNNVSVTVDLDEVPGVLASESRLCQVLINLLVNASQSMADRPADERKLLVRTRSDETAGLVGVEVSDTGVGIEPQNLDRIFEPFFTTKQSGTGLGLSISKESLERMGGRLEVTSTPGSGTTFTVWLSTTRSPVATDLERFSSAP